MRPLSVTRKWAADGPVALKAEVTKAPPLEGSSERAAATRIVEVLNPG
jgi:hypothetical protein